MGNIVNHGVLGEEPVPQAAANTLQTLTRVEPAHQPAQPCAVPVTHAPTRDGRQMGTTGVKRSNENVLIAGPVLRQAKPVVHKHAHKYKAPAMFKPPKGHSRDEIAYVKKYLWDFKAFMRYGVDDTIPPMCIFSQNSESTYELVQAMQAKETERGVPLTVDEVCTMIVARYLPPEDTTVPDARRNLLRGGVCMTADETVASYHARFVAEVAKCAAGMAAIDQVMLFQEGLPESLRFASCYDANANRLTTLPDVFRHALAAEHKLMNVGIGVRKHDSHTAARANAVSHKAAEQPGMEPNAKRVCGSMADQGRDKLSDIVDCHGKNLTPDEVKSHFREGLCFHCHEPGHRSSICPKADT